MFQCRRIALTVAAIGLSLGLAACSSGDSGDSSNDQTGAATQEAGGADGAVADGSKEGSAKVAGLDPQNLPEPIATEEIPAVVESVSDATMKVEVFGPYRQGKTVIAQFAFTVTADGNTEEAWIYDYPGGSSWSPFLIDSANLRKHSVLSADGEKAQTDYQGSKFAPGQTFYAFAVFAAPPADVQTVDISVVDGMSLVQGVEIK